MCRQRLLTYLGDASPLTELIRQGVADDALSHRGWLHAGITQMAGECGIPASAEAVPAPHQGEFGYV
jgi:hypothetical protein